MILEDQIVVSLFLWWFICQNKLFPWEINRTPPANCSLTLPNALVVFIQNFFFSFSLASVRVLCLFTDRCQMPGDVFPTRKVRPTDRLCSCLPQQHCAESSEGHDATGLWGEDNNSSTAVHGETTLFSPRDNAGFCVCVPEPNALSATPHYIISRLAALRAQGCGQGWRLQVLLWWIK